MKALDTNVLARFFIDDADDAQAALQRPAAIAALAERSFVSVTVLLELEWVMRGFYELSAGEVGGVLRALTSLEHITLEGADFARIPLHDAYLSAGPGAQNNDDVAIIDHLVFRHEWLRKVGVKPADAAMARISGDSMAPGIQSGDLVMIDKTRIEVPLRKPSRKPNQLPIFAFIQDEQARVKRLERLVKERLLILYSDNKDVPPEVIGETDIHALNILGQVVWSGHVWR